MYVIKDLVVDLNKFLEQHSRIKPYLIRKSKEGSGTTQYLQSIKDRENLVILFLGLYPIFYIHIFRTVISNASCARVAQLRAPNIGGTVTARSPTTFWARQPCCTPTDGSRTPEIKALATG